MKTLVKVLAGLVVVIAIVLVVGVMNLDKGVKAAVEKVGPQLTQSSVTLSDVDLSLKSGEATLSGLTVGNPSGFTSENAFSLGKITLGIDTQSINTQSINTDTLVINTLHIIAPEIIYEQAKGGSNISKLQQNIKQALGAEDGTETDSEGSGAEDSAASKKLIIKDLQITGGKVSYINPLLSAKPTDVTLPDLRMTGIGEKSNGATAAEVVNQVVTAINKSALKALSQEGLLKNLSSDAIEKHTSTLKEKLGGFKDLLKKDAE